MFFIKLKFNFIIKYNKIKKLKKSKLREKIIDFFNFYGKMGM